ncbi:MAG: hypothetical protein LQ343_000265 [Gyalolechia ehrenbergii]|nr:MAG: hypothetical protein LQ343_000265 [Gyalolechia ehrenbergii]
MPPVRSARNRKPPPDGFEDIEDTLLEFSNKMKDAENASHEGKKRHEVLWPIFQISHQRSRYIYELYYEKEAITKQLYEWLLKNGYADGNLIAKWKKQGYEKDQGCYQKPASELSSSSKIVEVKRLFLLGGISRSIRLAKSPLRGFSRSGDGVTRGIGGTFVFRCSFSFLLVRYEAIVLPLCSSSGRQSRFKSAIRKSEV